MSDTGTRSPAPDVHAALKRRIVALEEELVQLHAKVTKTPVHSYIREGRAIRRLVSLNDPVADLIAEYDRRVMLVEDETEFESVPSSDDEERAFRSYKKLVLWCPSVKKLTEGNISGYELSVACQELKKGADGARGDDANTLKHTVVTWLNQQVPHPVPLLNTNNKEGRGFNHDLTGRFLCPVDHDWLDTSICAAIREYHPHYSVTAHMWPAFLYPKCHYDPRRLSAGLFKGELLLRAFHCIFTSPSSARDELEADDVQGQPSANKARRTGHAAQTRCHVAGLLKMRSVQPRAIAYIAVQVRFALSNSTSWFLKDDNFDYKIFYHNIVNWFECPRTQAKTQEIEQLLLWWNRMIFGHQHAGTLTPQGVENLSVAASLA